MEQVVADVLMASESDSDHDEARHDSHGLTQRIQIPIQAHQYEHLSEFLGSDRRVALAPIPARPMLSANQVLDEAAMYSHGGSTANKNARREGSTPKYSLTDGTPHAPLRATKKKFERKFPHLNTLDYLRQPGALNDANEDENGENHDPNID